MATQKKLKLKKKYKNMLIFLLIVCICIFIGNKKINEYKYKKTYESQLLEMGYDRTTVNVFLEKLNEDKIKYILMSEKSDIFYNIITQKYYLDKNFESYYKYKLQNSNTSYKDTIALINTGSNNPWYENTKPVDINKGIYILVNKFNYLEQDYIPDDIVDISLQYSYEGNKARQEVYDAFKNMYNKAEENGIQLIITSSYRNYVDQEDSYNYYEYLKGKDYADSVAARGGHSEHQTGLTLDIFTPTSNMDNFKETDAYKWLQNNSYKFGFIERYKEGTEYITGYNAESWHYRYVGIDTATKIYNEGITYDEYYAYYIEK